MKIVLISDTHNTPIKNLPKADLLIHSGDWSGSGTYRETKDFINWLESISCNYTKIVVVPGNHDIWVENNQAQAKQEFLKSNIELLIDDQTNFMGKNIYGMPWSPVFGNWAFMAPLDKRIMACDAIPDDTNILVTHSPAKGYLDVLSEKSSEPGKNAGCSAIADAIVRVRPQLHVCGHIHESAGIVKIGETLSINASCLDEYYRLVNGFKVVYLS